MRKVISYAVVLALIPLLILLFMLLFQGENYGLLSALIAILSVLPFFFVFEKRKTHAREVVIIAVMTGLSVVGRLVFYPVPGFKPVTAIVIITAIALGSEAGFLTGALSALVSNMFFGQGPWTPFQMFAWGFLGFVVGLIAKTGIMKYRVSQCIAGVLGGVVFSMIMDIWTVLSFDSSFSLSRYLTFVVASFPFMAVYAVSNVIFLLLLCNTICRKIERVKAKYSVF